MAGEVASIQPAEAKKVDLKDCAEFKRYNGPVLIENTKTGQTRIYQKDDTGIFPETSPEETVFYPGLTLRDAGAKNRVTFAKIDTDKDTVLSEEEFNDAVSAKLKIDEAKGKIIKPNTELRNPLLSKAGWISMFAGIGTLITAICLEDVSKKLSQRIGIVGAIIGIGGLIALGKNLVPEFWNMFLNGNQVSKLEEKYKDNEYAKQLINKEINPHIGKE